jgi:6-pyruvoyl-tetrahydropterin synthase
MSGTFEVGTAVRLRAVHRVPWADGPEREPHEHEYRIEVIVARAGLDGRGVVIDLDVLQAGLDVVTATLEGQDLDTVIAPEDAGAVTVEVLARWIHGRLREDVRRAGADELAVRVWESPDAYGGYRASSA